jgi:phenylpropionate dioxygenase-like ring-hydroxylating dioxygenase large terminal subunit
MLSREENETLTRTGPGTLGGELIRRYWMPALLSSELPESDGTPVRVRLLGEDLVAFRDSTGVVGLLEEGCPHRRASLALGVNEESGIRCLYHGYKYDVDGRCVDTPTEPASSHFSAKIKAKAYPVIERAGVLWTYMGPAGSRPPLPDFAFFDLPEGNAVPFKTVEECNYAQAVEGAIDSAHAGALHRRTPWEQGNEAAALTRDLAPRLEVEYTKYGFRYGAIRNLDEQTIHVRITQMMLPFWTIIPPTGKGLGQRAGRSANRRLANAFVPRDDYSTWHFQYLFDDEEQIDVDFRVNEGGHWYEPGTFRKVRNIDNWYMQDREAMRGRTTFSGIDGIMTQDHAVNETQGAILDRTTEHLGTSDIAVIAWRRLMLRAMQDLSDGVAPTAQGAGMPLGDVTSDTIEVVVPTSWKDVVPLPPEFAAS